MNTTTMIAPASSAAAPTGGIKGWITFLVGLWAVLILGLCLLGGHWTHRNAQFGARGVAVEATTVNFRHARGGWYAAQVRFETPSGPRTGWVSGIGAQDFPVGSTVQVVYLPGTDDVRYPPYARDHYDPGWLVLCGMFATFAFAAVIAQQVSEDRTDQEKRPRA